MYIEFEKGREPWLFDIARDPDELHNLHTTPEGNHVLPDLLESLERLQARGFD
jgi:hypothetical protein